MGFETETDFAEDSPGRCYFKGVHERGTGYLVFGQSHMGYELENITKDTKVNLVLFQIGKTQIHVIKSILGKRG